MLRLRRTPFRWRQALSRSPPSLQFAVDEGGAGPHERDVLGGSYLVPAGLGGVSSL